MNCLRCRFDTLIDGVNARRATYNSTAFGSDKDRPHALYDMCEENRRALDEARHLAGSSHTCDAHVLLPTALC